MIFYFLDLGCNSAKVDRQSHQEGVSHVTGIQDGKKPHLQHGSLCSAHWGDGDNARAVTHCFHMAASVEAEKGVQNRAKFLSSQDSGKWQIPEKVVSTSDFAQECKEEAPELGTVAHTCDLSAQRSQGRRIQRV